MTKYNFNWGGGGGIKSNKQGSEIILSYNKTPGEKCLHISHIQ